MRRDDLDTLGDGQARRVGGDEEARNALRAGRFAGPGEDGVEIGDAAIGDPRLLSRQHVMVAVACRRHVHVGDVRARTRLRQGEGGERFAGAGLFQPLPVMRVAEEADGAGAQPLHGEGEIGQPVVTRQRLAGQAERAHVEGRGILRVYGGRLEPAVAAQFFHQLAAGRIDVMMIGRQVLRAP
jgi:hypothetical protein